MDLSPDKPIAGIMAPLFALRSSADLGIGDTRCLRELIEWAARIGFRLVQLLPINETGNDNSPYNSISSRAIDPTTIDTSPEAVEDLTREDFDQVVAGVDLNELRAGPVIYRRVKPLKRQLLARAFDRFMASHWSRNTGRARKFRGFVKAEAQWIEGYGLFRALMDENGGSEMWDKWRPEHRSVQLAKAWLNNQRERDRREFERRKRFHMYVQWVAFAQWHALKTWSDQRGVALMGDVPFGVSYYSADVYCQPELFDLAWSGGAPPEPYFKDDLFTQRWGQNWGVPIYRWDRMRKDGFAWWRQRVHGVREVFHLFRVDHALGFYRIYAFPWRPERNLEFLSLHKEQAREKTGGPLPHFIPHADSTQEYKEANRREGEEYLRALLAEVGEHRLIGEDLGTVPDYVRPSLRSLGIAGFKIPIWERKHDGWLIDGPQYHRLSVATYATHDHEPLRALWERWHRTLAHSDNKQQAREICDEMTRLAAFAGLSHGAGHPWSDDLHLALLDALCRSNSWIVIFMITDLLGSDRRFNVPGTAVESNWSFRLNELPDQWDRDPAMHDKWQQISAMLRQSGRV